MKRIPILSLLLCVYLSASAQETTLSFEHFNLGLDSFIDGRDTNFLQEECFEWSCEYDTAFGGFWSSGMAVSTMRDDTTGDYTNLFSSISGSGYNSEAYGVVSAGLETFIQVSDDCDDSFYGIRWMMGYVSNTTYAYQSMLNGDAFAKKFGGATGDDPDYLFIRYRFYDEWSGTMDSLPMSHFDLYLADFRDSDNSKDYIMDDWVVVDLNDYPTYEHGGYRVSMQLYSSDTGMFGINTPTYFCLDDLNFEYPSGLSEQSDNSFNLQVHSTSFDIASSDPKSKMRVYSMGGSLIAESIDTNQHSISTSSLPSGIYIVEFEEGGVKSSQKVFRW